MPEERVETGHYVAQLTLKRVDRVTKSEYNNGARTTVKTSERRVVDLASITVKGDDLESLVEKVKKHAELVDDIDDADD